MTQWRFTATRATLSDKVVRQCLRILTLIGFSEAALRWYLGPDAKRPELPDHERVLSLALYLSYTGEALTLLNSVQIKPHDTWPQVAQEAWEFLQKKEVTELFSEHLERIRNQGVFHVDPAPVMSYLEKVTSDGKGDVVLWETTESDPHGYPKVAADVIGTWLLDLSTQDHERAGLCARTNTAIWKVASAAIGRRVRVTGVTT